jgi:hypothetical protein
MKNHYLIAGIPIAIFHRENPYFLNNFEYYETDLVPEYSMNSFLVEEIHPLKLPITKQDSFRRFFQDSKYEYLEVLHQGTDIKYFIKRTQDYRETEIFIVEKYCKNVDESEYILMSMFFMDIAVQHGFLPLHASAIDIHGECILFSAPSGVGKSTHAHHYTSLFPEAIQLNDDKPLVKDNLVYGSPFSGKTSINSNQVSHLKAIVFLQQGIANVVHRLGETDGLMRLVRNTLRPSTDLGWIKVSSVMDLLVKTTPMYEAFVTKEEESAFYTYYEIFKNSIVQLKPGSSIKQDSKKLVMDSTLCTSPKLSELISLQPNGIALIEALRTPQSIQSLVELYINHYKKDEQTAKMEVILFIKLLQKHHILH